MKVEKIVIVVASIIILASLSGCVQMEKFKKLFISPPTYQWMTKVDQRGDFGIFDIINKNLGKVDYFPFTIDNGTKYLHVYIHVNFSKPVGFLNLTIVTPEKNITKEYSTIAKSYKYDDFLYFDDPTPGNWKIVIKVTGIGNYRLFAEAYQKV